MCSHADSSTEGISGYFQPAALTVDGLTHKCSAVQSSLFSPRKQISVAKGHCVSTVVKRGCLWVCFPCFKGVFILQVKFLLCIWIKNPHPCEKKKSLKLHKKKKCPCQRLFSAVVFPGWQFRKKQEEPKHGKLQTKLLKTLTLSSRGKGEEICLVAPDRNVVPGGRSHGCGISALIQPNRKDCVMTWDRSEAGVANTMDIQYLTNAV